MRIYFNYFKYVLLHKWYVFFYCVKFAFKYKIPGLVFNGIIHDWDKLLNPSIFKPYANATFGPGRNINYGLKNGMPDYKAIDNGGFAAAIYNHKNKSSHHWEYWKSKATCLEIPEVYLLELISDWISANRLHNDFRSSYEWYNFNKNKIQLNKLTRAKVEKLLKKECK